MPAVLASGLAINLRTKGVDVRLLAIRLPLNSQWRLEEKFDTIFFGFWLSHVPPERFEVFWELTQACLAPDGRVFFVDSRPDPVSTAKDHSPSDPAGVTIRRRLNNGREFEIFKIFYEPAQLAVQLRGFGWNFEVRQTPRYFLHAAGQRRQGMRQNSIELNSWNLLPVRTSIFLRNT